MLYFITGNENKFNEVRAVIPGVERLDIDLPEIQEMDGHAIVRAKLEEARKQHAGEFIVEDTSLCLDALNGLPGPFIKWFLQTLGNEKLAGIAAKLGNDRALARTIIGYADARGEVHPFEGVVKGRIVAPRGTTHFGWDPIFLPDGHELTFAEMEREEKNGVSMRRKALDQLKEYLAK